MLIALSLEVRHQGIKIPGHRLIQHIVGVPEVAVEGGPAQSGPLDNGADRGVFRPLAEIKLHGRIENGAAGVLGSRL